MTHKQPLDKTDIFANTMTLTKVDKKVHKQPPHVNTNISAYDRVVQVVSNDGTDVNLQQEESNKRYTLAFRYGFICCLFSGSVQNKRTTSR